jgi:hypothetical protein
VKSCGISNQPTYNQDRTDLATIVHMIHRVHNKSGVHRSRNKSYYNIVQNNIAEASSFTHTLSSNTMSVDSHGLQKH